MRALTEKQCTGHKRALRNDHHSPTLLGGTVDDGLNLWRLHLRASHHHAIVGDNIPMAQRADIHLLRVLEPGIHRSAIGPRFFH